MIDDVKDMLLSKWSNENELDGKLQTFNSKYDSWLNQFSNEYQNIIVRLLKELRYFTKKKTNKILNQLHHELLDKYPVTDDNTVYSFIKSKDGKSNSSNDYWTEYKNINDLNRNICYENIDCIDDNEWICIKNVVFIDDFCGTGKSVITYLKENVERYKGKTVFIIVISIMNQAINKLQRFAIQNDFEIVCLYGECREKLFKEKLFGEDNQKLQSKYLEITEEYGIGYQLGRDNTQAMVSLYNNTPNNTLGFIHCKSEKYMPIFPRKFDKPPSWQTMMENRKQRKNANYNNMKVD